MFLVSFGGDLVFYFRLHYVVDGQSQRDASQGSCPARTAVDQRFRIKFRAIGIWSAKNNDEIIVAVFIC